MTLSEYQSIATALAHRAMNKHHATRVLTRGESYMTKTALQQIRMSLSKIMRPTPKNSATKEACDALALVGQAVVAADQNKAITAILESKDTEVIAAARGVLTSLKTWATDSLAALGGTATAQAAQSRPALAKASPLAATPLAPKVPKVPTASSIEYGRMSQDERRAFLRANGQILPTTGSPRRQLYS